MKPRTASFLSKVKGYNITIPTKVCKVVYLINNQVKNIEE